MKAPVPQVSLEKEEVLWRTVQMDAFYFRHEGQVHHFILFMDEASSFAVVSEILAHDAEEGANINTEEAIDALEQAWVQYLGYFQRLRCDLETAFAAVASRTTPLEGASTSNKFQLSIAKVLAMWKEASEC